MTDLLVVWTKAYRPTLSARSSWNISKYFYDADDAAAYAATLKTPTVILPNGTRPADA